MPDDARLLSRVCAFVSHRNIKRGDGCGLHVAMAAKRIVLQKPAESGRFLYLGVWKIRI